MKNKIYPILTTVSLMLYSILNYIKEIIEKSIIAGLYTGKIGMIMKIKLALLAAAVLVLASCSASQNPSSENSSVVDADMNGSSVAYEVDYNTMSADWPIYKDVTELTEAANVILLGKVTGISFQVLDDRTAQPPSEETEEWNRSLNTIYDVDVITSYKGDSLKNIKVRMLGGQKGVYVEEQLSALGEDAKNGIPIMEGMPEIKIGETYLFVLYQYKDTMPTLVNVGQGVYELHDPLAKDQYSFVSPKDIISYFGKDKWDEFQEKGMVSE